MPKRDEALDCARRIAARALGDADDLRRLPAGNHAVFAVLRGDQRWVLKLARPDAAGVVAIEVAAIALAGSNGVPVPQVELADAQGTLEGRPFLLMRSAGTRTVMDEMAGAAGGGAVQLVRDMAAALAATHRIRAPHDPCPELPTATAEHYRALLRDLQREALADGALAPPQAQAFSRLLADLPPLGGDVLCHGDFHAPQCLARAGRVCAVVDWETASFGDPLVDLSLTQAYLDLYMHPDLVREFLAAYAACNPLPDGFSVRYRGARAAQTLAMLRRWRRQGQRGGAGRARRQLAEYLHSHDDRAQE